MFSVVAGCELELLLPCIVGDGLLDNQLEVERAQQKSQRMIGESGSNVVKMAVEEPGGTGRGDEKVSSFQNIYYKTNLYLKYFHLS